MSDVIVASILLSFALQAPTKPDPDPRAKLEAETAEARARFAKLSEAERKDLGDYFASEARSSGSVQAGLIKFVLGTQDRDPSLWPEEEPAPFFDSKEHTPENDIPRHRL